LGESGQTLALVKPVAGVELNAFVTACGISFDGDGLRVIRASILWTASSGVIPTLRQAWAERMIHA
jgi:hypothetical protein